MESRIDFQTIILKLQQFWHEQGCLIWQPYYTQVGAGTFNPATVLRVLGPEPWNVAYVEPSIRPDDGRYGENPYRLLQHYQFQVILKPDPGNSQELYIRSLEALGVNPREHDIRFVEDNWVSPALGAWGLGWEVWLDGQEITQFTYFQQAGGMALDPVSVEITYGLERITLPLQKVRHFRDIQWSPDRTYGDVNLQSEQEQSKYCFETADVDRIRKMYDLFEAEAEESLKNGLVLPAHDWLLKCSHAFNILDTRGAVGVTERQDLFRRMRDLSHQVAKSYLEQRERMGYPWLTQKKGSTLKDAYVFKSLPIREPALEDIPENDHFLFEIGTEEMPFSDQISAQAQLRKFVPEMLAELRLKHGEIKILGTPRRLVISVSELASFQEDLTRVVKGPPANRAFDGDGKPTRAAEGFARGKGLEVDDLEVHEIDGGEYVVAIVHETGKTAIEALSGALPDLISGIKFNRPMRWNSRDLEFSRPIRWLLALFGEYVIPFEYAGLSSVNYTRGLRFHEPQEMEIIKPQNYFDVLADQGIVLDSQKRRERIKEQVVRLATGVAGSPVVDDDLLDEVTFLVEAPTALRGEFKEDHLKLPEPVLVSVMKNYQRYFPVRSAVDGSLLPYFVAVRNGDELHLDVVKDGNELVIGARFQDADFFISEDLKQKLEDYLPRLSTLIFQFKLGSMLEKTQRIEQLVEQLAPEIGLPESGTALACRSARLCKADLVTHMVIEMTSLQGIMGRHYALKSGEDDIVAQAIFEHYLPAYAGDQLPKSRIGFLVGLADRLDSLVGLFAAGMAPTGTRDPFAQRRMALGMIQNLIALDLDFDLQDALSLAAKHLPIAAELEVIEACLEFVVARLRNYLIEQGFSYDVVDAVLASQRQNPAGAIRSVRELTE
ncbi:MAG: glycine--tRNA ligase subunit beta, partial [Anaerolineaceae bacterium]|nr:glycine--tRNA ligase subunit beta [Anaerolineaceae bacterium]